MSALEFLKASTAAAVQELPPQAERGINRFYEALRCEFQDSSGLRIAAPVGCRLVAERRP